MVQGKIECYPSTHSEQQAHSGVPDATNEDVNRNVTDPSLKTSAIDGKVSPSAIA